MIDISYANYAWEQTAQLLSIDSPSGFTGRAALWVKGTFEKMGFCASITTKGGVLIDLGGENSQDALFLEAHLPAEAAPSPAAPRPHRPGPLPGPAGHCGWPLLP